MNPRLAAVYVLQQVLQQGRNLPDALQRYQNDLTTDRDRALVQALCYGVARHYFSLEALLQQLLQKPLKDKDRDIHCLLLSGLYQIIHMRIPDHAAVSETVNLVTRLKKNWARGMVNAVLRNYLRQAESLQAGLQQSETARYDHPGWLLELLKTDWPDHWRQIVESNNREAPMTLRVNAQQGSRDDYLQQLIEAGIIAQPCTQADAGIRLAQATAVDNLPGFRQGRVSVQDEAAQLAAALLAPAAGERILDACAAPGGKAAHLLERQPELSLLDALEIEDKRIEQIDENLTRLKLNTQEKLNTRIVRGDATRPQDWWDGQLYDRILLDAPCSATGVIRRHPDIKLLRRQEDIDRLVSTQQQILVRLWPLLKSGGILLYITCSVLQQENTQQILNFLEAHTDARLQSLDVDWGHATAAGQQIFPGEEEMDGFFYACIKKV